jgi:enamine deaminase RidA (YjgF/YER057c/UK114 family)
MRRMAFVTGAQGGQMTPESRLKELGLELPKVPPGSDSVAMTAQIGNLLLTSAHGPCKDGVTPEWVGKLGREIDVETGYKAARLIALACLASIRAVLGNLDRVKRVIKVVGFVASEPGFVHQSLVMNGFSDLILEVFGAAGRHVRTTVGAVEMPYNQPMEIEMWAEFE